MSEAKSVLHDSDGQASIQYCLTPEYENELSDCMPIPDACSARISSTPYLARL